MYVEDIYETRETLDRDLSFKTKHYFWLQDYENQNSGRIPVK